MTRCVHLRRTFEWVRSLLTSEPTLSAQDFMRVAMITRSLGCAAVACTEKPYNRSLTLLKAVSSGISALAMIQKDEADLPKYKPFLMKWIKPTFTASALMSVRLSLDLVLRTDSRWSQQHILSIRSLEASRLLRYAGCRLQCRCADAGASFTT